MSITFQKSGPENTTQTIEIAFKEAKSKGIEYIVIASTTGDTAKAVLDFHSPDDVKVIIVTHNTGFAKSGEQQFDDEIRKTLIKTGITVHTGTMVLRNQGSAIRKSFGYSQEELVNKSLRMVGQGVKVGIEMAAMVCDAGLVPPSDIITVAGTAKGADTAMIVAAESSNRFFDIRVREILVKPW